MGLTAEGLASIVGRYHDRLHHYREALDRLNVYPVPDGDTGTNMALTVESVLEELRQAEGMQAVSAALAHGSLMGARGNSGVILSQILRGLTGSLGTDVPVGRDRLVAAFGAAAEAAYESVLRPVEGTILTVMREAAEAAAAGPEGGDEDLAAMMERTYRGAVASLERTPELLPVLAEAGVVDAGGAGLVLLLGSFLEEVTGEDVTPPEGLFAAVGRVAHGTHDSGESGIADLRYEIMFFLDADDARIPEMKAAWADLGDSIVIVGGDGTWNCHIHADDVGPAIEAGIRAGRPYDIRVTDLLEEAAHEAFHRRPPFEPLAHVRDASVGVVPVAVGDGLVEMFRRLGAQGVVVGGQTMNPATADLLEVVEAVPAKAVIVLPNNKNIVPVAEQLDALSTKRVLVVPTRTVPQGLAAMVAYDPTAGAEALVPAMEAAAGDVTTGELTCAVRDARIEAGSIVEGDWLGLVDGEVRVVERDPVAALTGLLALTVHEDHELVTLITGDEAVEEVTEAALQWLAEHRPGAETEVTGGGQPLYPYLVSVE